jgi:hypothetical protein
MTTTKKRNLFEEIQQGILDVNAHKTGNMSNSYFRSHLPFLHLKPRLPFLNMKKSHKILMQDNNYRDVNNTMGGFFMSSNNNKSIVSIFNNITKLRGINNA